MVLKNKKGIFFTIVAILLISIFLASWTIYSEVQDRKAVQKRISTMNNYLFSIEKDLSRKVYISGYRIIFLSEKNIIETGNYMTDFDSIFQEAFFNSTMYNESQEILESFSFEDIKTSVEETSSKVNANLILSNPKVNVSQSDPWNVDVTLTIDILLQDNSNLASWNKTAYIHAYIPITNFEDPLYPISTTGLLTNKITKSPFSSLISGTNVSNLILHATNSYYVSSTSAPSFLYRIKGINSPSEYGIESLVNPQDISEQGLHPSNKSIVDYIYFSSSNPSHFGITGAPNWLRLDQVHIASYNLSGVYY